MKITRKQLTQAFKDWKKETTMTPKEMAKFSEEELDELRADTIIELLGVKERSRPVKAEYGFQRKNYYCSLIASNGNVLFHGSGWDTIASMMKAIAAIQESEIVMVNKDLDA